MGPGQHRADNSSVVKYKFDLEKVVWMQASWPLGIIHTAVVNSSGRATRPLPMNVGTLLSGDR